jgi:hypothetical protein
MNTFKYTDQEHESVIQQLHEIANEYKCDFDYDDIPYQESKNNLLDNYNGDYDSDGSTLIRTDDNEYGYSKNVIRITIKHFKKKVIVYCVKRLNYLGRKYKLKFYMPKIKTFIRNVSVKKNEMLLGMTLHKILLKYDNECRSNNNAIERSEEFQNINDFLNKTFEQLIISYTKSNMYKNHIRNLEIKYKKYCTLFKVFGNERHYLFYPNFIRNLKIRKL